MMKPTSSRTAEERVRMALALIEEAQSLINCAAQELCDVRGMCPEWEGSRRVHDTIKLYWQRVNRKFQGLRSAGPLQLGDTSSPYAHLQADPRG
jgi:hypothetical protein